MEYTHLGRSGVSVSRICLGTMNFGSYTEPADAHTIMNYALEHGVNFFDTANTYGRPRADGVTESIIGDWFAGGPAAATGWCSRRSCTAGRATGPTTSSCPR